MSESPDAPAPYRVVYSDVVKAALRELTTRATQSGQRGVFVHAVRKLDRILHLYPQFGEPLIDLELEDGQIWHCSVGPLVVRYAIYEERRLVMVAVPPVLLPVKPGG